jgi:hypothetical protein
VIGGYDAKRGVDDVLLDNVTIAGRRIDLRDPEAVKVGPFATNVRSR